tara:strand:- start:13 stop:549 length:537 start_codon:yes stop_codon:yes gene_type:complete
MKFFICFFLFFILFNKSYSGDIEWTISGVDDIKIVNINENHFYIKYQNSSQIETNTSLFGFQTCYGTVEVKGDDMDQTIYCTNTDSYGNKGYLKSIPADKKKFSLNKLGKRVGSSIGSWIFIGGEGPFEELIGTTMTGAYFQMGKNDSGQGNFIWKGKSEGISDSVISRINSFSKKDE